MAPKPKPKPKGQVEVTQTFVRGHAAVKAFFEELASVSDLPMDDVKKMFEGMQKLIVQNLRSKSSFTLPSVGVFSVKTIPGTAEGPGTCNGKEFTRREKPAKKKVICKVAAALSDKVVTGTR